MTFDQLIEQLQSLTSVCRGDAEVLLVFDLDDTEGLRNYMRLLPDGDLAGDIEIADVTYSGNGIHLGCQVGLPETLTLYEAAMLLEAHPNTVSDLITSGKLELKYPQRGSPMVSARDVVSLRDITRTALYD